MSGCIMARFLSLGSNSGERGDGSLNYARGVAVSSDNKIWVADQNKARLQVYSMEGVYLYQFPRGAPGLGYPSKEPRDVSIDRDGHLWVLMSGYPASPDSLVQFGRDGHLQAKFDLPDTVPGQSYTGMAVDLRNNRILVTWSDGIKGGMQAFNPDGKLLWSDVGRAWIKAPKYVAVDREGNSFVSDYGTHSIYKYDASGRYVSKFGGPGLSGGRLNRPQGICVDSQSGHIVVVDSNNQRVVVYTSQGAYVRHIALRIAHPRGVAVGQRGELVVANKNTIFVFARY
ncbi:tripartite motif-containing protein 3-like [Branchiostoma floridae]|uniref:Tripartite motif-containing protein 3-like n=1 Tax=Branchiostoma floridae TaxID=7739 RepID=A0A9J7HRZ6_BRAFL|nr:tripartite motif-containing protein 3-like [Branchiostoma floridae]